MSDFVSPYWTPTNINPGVYKGVMTAPALTADPTSLYYLQSPTVAFGPRSWVANYAVNGLGMSADESTLYMTTATAVLSAPTSSGWPGSSGASAAGLQTLWTAATFNANTEYRGIVRAPFVVCPRGSYAASANLATTAACTSCAAGTMTASAGATSESGA